MKVRAILVLMLAAPLTLAPLHAGSAVALRVTPSVAFEPADMTIRATVESNPENRSLEVIAESDDFYRSSLVPLVGEGAPRTTFVSFRSVPGGEYLVRVIVRGSRGQELATSERAVRVVTRDGSN